MDWLNKSLMNSKRKLNIPFTVILILILVAANFFVILVSSGSMDSEAKASSNVSEDFVEPSQRSGSYGSMRGTRSIGFTVNSTGLPSTGGYNFIAFGDINNDGQIDVASGGEDRGSLTTTGLYAYTGNGGSSWSAASTGLWTGNSWGGVQLADADGDGYIELYATDERWGATNSSGLRVFEYRSGTWTNSATHVSTPRSTGQPDNVLIVNITGDNKLDMVVSNSTSGLAYYENTGGNPVNWQNKANGLGTSSEYTTFAVADMNKDGLKDIVASDYSGGEHLFVQRTSGNLWAEYSTGLSISGNVLGVAIGDVNGDTHMDIVYGRQGSGLRCLLGDSAGGSGGTTFSWTAANTGLPTSGQYWQIALADLDLDGDLDFIGPRSSPDNKGIEIYLGNGNTNPGLNLGWTKATNTNLPATGNYAHVNCYDINNDGSQDIAAAAWGQGLDVFINNLSGNFDLTPPGAISDLQAESATTTTITVNWSAPSDNGTNVSTGLVQSYYLRYSNTGTITLGNWDSAIPCTGLPTPAVPNTIQNYTITNLDPGTTYYIAIRSQDERPNLSPLSNILINTTLGAPDLTLPGKIYNLQALNATNNSINLTWTAPADNGSNPISGPVIEYEIKYNSTAAITNLTWVTSPKLSMAMTPKSPGSKEEINVTGLQAETTYYFAIKSRDEKPNWAWLSNIASDTTMVDQDITPPAIITDLVASGPTDTTINLTWSAPGDDGSIGTANLYDIRYATSTITDLTWASATECTNEPTPGVTSTAEQFQVTGLNPDTTYYFAIKTSDEKPLWSGLSNIAINKTLLSSDVIAPNQITDLAAIQPTDSSVTLTWTAPGDDAASGTVAGYDIRYSTEPITSALWSITTKCPDYPTPVSPGSQQQYQVSGLISSQKYYFAIKAFDERPNYSPLSNIANATTLPSTDNIKPAAITDLVASTLSQNSVQLTWSASGDDGAIGTATGYDIRYSITEITGATWVNASTCDSEPVPKQQGSIEVFNVTGLFSGKKYYFAIKAFDERPNFGDLSNIASATTYSSTDMIRPNGIIDLAVLETTKSSVTITWSAPGDDGDTGTATAYDVRYAEAEIHSTNWISATKALDIPTPKPAGETEIFLVTGLEQDTTYYFSIRAADERPNWSPLSNSPSGTTLGQSLPRILLTVAPDKTVLSSEEVINIELLTNSSATSLPLSGVAVSVSSDYSGLDIAPISGETDQDGILNVGLAAPSVDVSTQITIYFNFSKTSYKPNNTQIIITVNPVVEDKKYNLRITSSDITVSPAKIEDGNNVTIYANITNNGFNAATPFNVRFYIDDVQLGTDQPVSTLAMGGYHIAEIIWQAFKGNHSIRVDIVLGTGASLDTNPLDNSAQISVSVSEKSGDGGGDGDGDGEASSNKEDDSSLLLILMIMVIIIVVVVALLFVLRKKKQAPPEESEPIVEERVGDGEVYAEESREVPQQYDAYGAPIHGELTAEPGMPMEPEQPLDTGFESRQELVAGPGQEPLAEAGFDTEPDAEGSEIVEGSELEAETGAEEPDEETGEEIDWDTNTDGQDSDLDESVTETETQEPGQTEPEENSQVEEQVQNVPCPTCQAMIPVYSTPCSSCGTKLNW